MTRAKYERCKRALARYRFIASRDTKYRLGNECNAEPNLGDWLAAKIAERDRLTRIVGNYSHRASRNRIKGSPAKHTGEK
ncbi:hypothetical protein M0Q28_06175 [Patescibacteria group bacterium]|jgi:hypothetical protein|nr:hypothetical protein [Patescibacteria group bacterium]